MTTKPSIRAFTGRTPLLLSAPAAILVSLFSAAGQATTITVNSTERGTVNNQLCGLQEAIFAVSTQTPASPANGNDCPAGNGVNDQIILPAGTFPEDAAMTIDRDVQITGAGPTKTILVTGGLFGFDVAPRPDIGKPQTIAVKISNLTVKKDPAQTQYVTGLRVSINEVSNPDSFGSMYLDNLVVTDMNGYGVTGGSVETYLQITNSTIQNNPVGVLAFGVLKIVGSAIVNNTGPQFGGIESPGVTFKGVGNSRIINSTISGNVSSNTAGGLYSEVADTGILEVFSSTISNNTAQYAGGGIFEATTQSTTLRTYDSIIANNHVVNTSVYGAAAGPDVHGNTNSLGCLYSDMSGKTGSSDGDIVGNAQLGPLTDSGGLIATKFHPLRKTSPAIDLRSSIISEAQTDQRRVLRPLDGPDTNTTAEYDLGAVEYDPNWQAETLAVAAVTANRTHAIIDDTAYTNGHGMRFEATSTNDVVTYAIPIMTTGQHTLKARVRKGTDRGIYQIAVASSPSGPWTNLGSQDFYNNALAFADVTLGTPTFPTTGTKYVRFTVTGLNAASLGRWLYLDWIQTGE